MAKAVALQARPAYINGKVLSQCTLEVEYEQIDVTTEFEPDPNWTFTDAAGHFHAYTKSFDVPTLNRRSIEEPCNGMCDNEYDEPCEGYTRIEYYCRICDEIVEPKSRRTSGRKYVEGRAHWTVTVSGLAVDLWPHLNGQVSFWMADPDGRVTHFGVGLLTGLNVESDNGFALARIVENGELGTR